MAGISDKAIKTNYAENKYRYNGKELNSKEFSDGTGLEEYDFALRYQDPQIGAWHSIDPLAERSLSSSPYSYALDNPVAFIDPTGAYIAPAASLINESYGSNAGFDDNDNFGGSRGGGGGGGGGGGCDGGSGGGMYLGEGMYQHMGGRSAQGGPPACGLNQVLLRSAELKTAILQMNALRQIIEELSYDNKSLAGPLLKTKVLASRIKNQVVFNWASRELIGYRDEKELPAYRFVRPVFQWEIVQAGISKQKAVVPISIFDEKNSARFFRGRMEDCFITGVHSKFNCKLVLNNCYSPYCFPRSRT